MIGDLSKKYDSNGNPGIISTGWGDAGGKSYGTYQFASAVGSLASYLTWLVNNGYWFGRYLLDLVPTSAEFDKGWQWLANSDNKEDFAKSQHDYIEYAYYVPSIRLLSDAGFNVDNHSDVMRDVIWSRAVQYGTGYIVEMFTEACNILGHPNLSYVDDISFDYMMIKAIYLGVCKTPEWTNGSPDLREGLYNRFDNECAEALEKLTAELS
mgnify:CR=1 FL=1